MKIVVTSDFHGSLPRDEVPPCDLLVIAGDVGFSSDSREFWLKTEFRRWLERQPAIAIVGVAGNHDWGAQSNPNAMRSLPWVYLCDEAVDLGGFRVYGSPYSNLFNDWAFMEPDDELAARWERIPSDTQVLVVHGPAANVLDDVHGKHVGSVSLAARIRELPRLRLLVTGHIHEAYGETSIPNVAAGEPIVWIRCVNGAWVDGRYKPGNLPIELDLEKELKDADAAVA